MKNHSKLSCFIKDTCKSPMKCIIFSLIACLVLAFCVATASSSVPEKNTSQLPTLKATSYPNQISHRYDMSFITSMSIHFPDIDWQMLKAMCFVESSFNPKAVSKAGAKGICQFMPATWAETPHAQGDIFNAHQNIDAAAFHLEKLWREWEIEDLSRADRSKLMISSYNAGLSNIKIAYELWKKNTKDEDTPLLHYLPKVTGKHSIETINYVEKVLNVYMKIISEEEKF